MEINNILTMDLSKKVTVLRDGANLVLSYSADGKIISKVISGNESITGLIIQRLNYRLAVQTCF